MRCCKVRYSLITWILIALIVAIAVWTVLVAQTDYSLVTNNDIFVDEDYLNYSNGEQLKAFFPDDLEICDCMFIEYSEAHLNRLLPPWFYLKKYSDLYYLELFFPSKEASSTFFESLLMDHLVSSGAFSDSIQYAFLLDCCVDKSDRALIYHNAELHIVGYCWFTNSSLKIDIPVTDMYKLPYQFPAAWDPRRCGNTHFSLLNYALPTASLSSGHTAGHSGKDEYGRESVFGMEMAGELFNDCGNGSVYVYYVIQERTDSQIGLYPVGILVSDKRLTALSKEWKNYLNENDWGKKPDKTKIRYVDVENVSEIMMKQYDRNELGTFLAEYLGYGDMCFDVIFDSGERFTAVVREKTKTGSAEYSYGNWMVLNMLHDGDEYSVISLMEAESFSQLIGTKTVNDLEISLNRENVQ